MTAPARLVYNGPNRSKAMDNEFTGQFKTGPRHKGRKDKGKKRPQAVRQAKKSRSTLIKSLHRSG